MHTSSFRPSVGNAQIAGVFLLGLLWCVPVTSRAAVECRWTDQPVTVDGRSDEAGWQSADWIDGFRRLGTDSPTVSHTRTALLWDREGLYFFAEMEDKDLFADVTEHDGPTWSNDVFELFLRPSVTELRYYEFEVNARNTRFDLLLHREGDMAGDVARDLKADAFEWETVVIRRGTLNERGDHDSGWTVEGRIPWSDLKPTGGSPKDGDDWSFLLARYDYTKDREPELSTNTALGAEGGFHQPEAWGSLKFVGPEIVRTFAGWKNTRLQGSPDPPLPFRVAPAYPDIHPDRPIAIHREPGADRILFLENYGYNDRRGAFKRFNVEAASSNAVETLLEFKAHPYGITFHPDFLTNGFVYLGLNGPDDHGVFQTRIERHTLERTAPWKIVSGSRRVIIEWPSDGHNGGDCAFGNDGMLYVTSGDGTSGSDINNTGQDLSTLLGKVLRIDVDGAAADQAYITPADNPFVSVPEARPEIWAYGMRNPWRITADRTSGQLWVGQNGQDLREYAHLLGRGENYGWSAYEGSRPFVLNRLRGPAPFTPPTVEHDHGSYRSLTGGRVYRGSEFPDLVGAYLYGDYSTGRMGAVKHDGEKVVWQKELADTALSIVGFGEDVDGEMLIVDYNGGFYQLAASPPEKDSPPFPRLLSETGLFADTAAQEPAPGVLPYEINVPGWHDGARGEHWLAIPDQAHIRAAGGQGQWSLDNGMAAVQTLSLGEGRNAKRVETRLLLKQENDWSAYSYVWNESQTDAELAPGKGRQFTIETGSGRRRWSVPTRTECLVCHSRAAEFALSINSQQLNRPFADTSMGSQLHWLEQQDLIRSGEASSVLPSSPNDSPRFPSLADTQVPIEKRARTYLAVNCAHCHTSDGGGNSAMNMSPGLPLDQAHLIDEMPRHGNFNIKDARIMASGSGASVLLMRMGMRTHLQMPPVGSLYPDPEGMRLIAEWIAALKKSATQP